MVEASCHASEDKQRDAASASVPVWCGQIVPIQTGCAYHASRQESNGATFETSLFKSVGLVLDSDVASLDESNGAANVPS